MVEAAVASGLTTFGLSEHAPRGEARFLYPSERQKGFTVQRLQADFDAYAAEAKALAQEFRDRIEVLVGFEARAVAAAEGQEVEPGGRAVLGREGQGIRARLELGVAGDRRLR